MKHVLPVALLLSSVCLVEASDTFGLVFQPLKRPRISAPAVRKRSATAWRLGVVFRRTGGRRIYAGTVQQASLPTDLGSLVPAPMRAANATSAVGEAAPAGSDYEVWLAGDGNTCGLWYSSTRRQFGRLYGSTVASSARRDDGTIARVVSAARMSQPAAKLSFHAEATAIGDGPPPPPTLSILAGASDAVVEGPVAGVLLHAHTPENSPYAKQHTVFVVAVEEVLKSPESGLPAIVKVNQPGGPLPWRDREARTSGVGYRIINSPMLEVGQRYILFLRHPGTVPGHFARLGYVPAMTGGIEGKGASLDEYVLTEPIRGQIIVSGGVTRPPVMNGRPEAWRFEADSVQMFGVPEGRVQAAIRAVAAPLAKSP